MKPDSADWYKEGAVSMETITYVLQQLSPLELVKVKTKKTTKQFLSQTSKEPEFYLVSGWLNNSGFTSRMQDDGKAKKGREKKKSAKKAKTGKKVVVRGEDEIFSIQKKGEKVCVKWEPLKVETQEPMENLKQIEEIHTEAFKSGSEVLVGKGSSFTRVRKVLAMKKKDQKGRDFGMHAIPAWLHLDLCRDPLKPTKVNQSWIAGGTDLKTGIWKNVFQQDKWSTSILKLQRAPRAFSLNRPNCFLNPGPRDIASSGNKAAASSGSDQAAASTGMATNAVDTATTALTTNAVDTATTALTFPSSGSDQEAAASTGMATNAVDTATTALTESTAADVKRKSSVPSRSSGSGSKKRARFV